MFFRSIQWRLIFILSLITLVLMIVVWVFLNFQVEQSYYDSFRSEIARNYASLNVPDTVTVAELREILTTEPVIAGLILGEYRSVTLIDRASGEIRYSTDPFFLDEQSRGMFRAAIFQSVNLMAVMNGAPEGAKSSATRTRLRGLDDFYDYVLLQNTAESDTILFFKYSRDRALDVLDNFNNMILTSVMVALVAALGIGAAMSRTITRPITDIMRKAESITAGEFGQLLEVRSSDEIGKLTSTFNFMSTRLKAMLTEIASEKNKVETVINHMSDGVLAFDRNGIAIQVNNAATNLISGAGGPKRKKFSDKPLRFSDLMKDLGLNISLEEVLDFSEPVKKSISVPFNEQYLRLQFATFADDAGLQGGIIVVLQDITEDQRLENMRREFVANVSHELRTPLTSVKSYTETLMDGAIHDFETTMKFLKVINEETDRMVRLVKDLLVLSQHDSGLTPVLSQIDPESIVRICIERLRHSANEKGQIIIFSGAQKLPETVFVLGDSDRFEQLMLNIIGNAVKYTPHGGSIEVEFAVSLGQLRICVKDSGIGIPEEDLGRIFERFYRVDKARSRQMGGTGLGLAIAKEIVVLHGGTIVAKSKIGVGSEIITTIPISGTL